MQILPQLILWIQHNLKQILISPPLHQYLLHRRQVSNLGMLTMRWMRMPSYSTDFLEQL